MRAPETVRACFFYGPIFCADWDAAKPKFTLELFQTIY
jgi:hypothetical protein